MNRICHADRNLTAGRDKLISGKIDFKIRNMTRNKHIPHSDKSQSGKQNAKITNVYSSYNRT